MNKTLRTLPLIAAITAAAFVNAQSVIPVTYPKIKKVDTVDTYFGTKVADPYRWLENDNSDETKEWVKEENKVTYDYLSKLPQRDKIKARMKELWNFARMTAPYKKGDNYIFSKNDGVQNQSVIYVQEGIKGTPRILLDPNALSSEGTVAVTNTAVSNDGKYFAYGIAKAGSDWDEFHVIDIATGKQLPDQLNWIKFSGIAWRGNGFYYSRYDAPEQGKALSKKNEFHKLYFHKLGDTQDKDELIFVDKENPLRNIGADVTDDEKYLIKIQSQSTSGTSFEVKDLTAANAKYTTIDPEFNNTYHVVGNEGSILYVITNNKAPKYRLVAIDVNNPKPENWKNILAEKADLLESVNITNNKIVAKYLKDVSSRLFVYDMTGKELAEIKMPGIGMCSAVNTEKKDSLLFYSYASFNTPATIYKHNILTGKTAVYFQPKTDFNPADYETKQVFYPSKDGTKIPMFITYKKGTKLDGSAPAFLYGYGGFNISVTPDFRIERMVFLENGGIYAVANMRGGGEYGEDWHKAGTKTNKQNVFDDFIAAAEYLVKEKYTTHQRLAIYGRSNGGLLVGAVMTERPDIAKVCLPAVGVLDMLRFHKFTIGWAWTNDYGSSDNEEQFKYLYKYSPLHNVKNIEYPATMVTTADHDDRVVPAHSFKFISTLQEKQKGNNPVLIRIETNAGHGAGKPTAKQIDEFGDMWAFTMYHLGMTIK